MSRILFELRNSVYEFGEYTFHQKKFSRPSATLRLFDRSNMAQPTGKYEMATTHVRLDEGSRYSGNGC